MPIDLRISKVISHIAFSFRILGRHVALIMTKQQLLNGLDSNEEMKELVKIMGKNDVLCRDDLLKELVLGGTWRRHDDLDLSEKQLETRTEDICVIQESNLQEII